VEIFGPRALQAFSLMETFAGNHLLYSRKY
jgi:hypothetical protein